MKKYQIGYTTGVYDLFHRGHLNLLENAKQYCEKLIVGVTTDSLSMQRKKKSPIICQNDRMAIVGALKVVDQVVEQDTMDKFSAWEKFHFDVMFVGDDWKGTKEWVAYEEQFRKVDVDIIFLKHTDGISSTLLREALLDKVKNRN